MTIISHNLPEPLVKIITTQYLEVIEENQPDINRTLEQEGEVAMGIRVAMHKSDGGKVVCQTRLSFSLGKVSSEATSTYDPKQPELPGMGRKE